MKNWIVILTLVLSFSACRQDEMDQWRSTDLLPYGIPMSIKAPDSIDVETSDMGGLLQDVTIKGGENYYIQIYASDAETTDVAKVKAQQLAQVKSNRYFSEIVEEEEAGFIYQTQIDSLTNYGFRYIRLQGDKEYIFQTGLTGMYSLEEARRMYEAVKPEEQR